MADHEAYADFCGIPASQIPADPESLPDPKQLVMSWAENGRAAKLARHIAESRKRAVPDWASLGEWHAEFAENQWSPERAITMGRSPSLARALASIKSVMIGL
jgi:hypothetical protein